MDILNINKNRYKVGTIKQRWWIYLIIGIAFGVFDFYYHSFLSSILARQQAFTPSTGGEIIWLTLSIGIWLVPIIPIAIYEAKTSKSKLLSSLASTLTWCASIFSYYLTNAFQLAFIGSPARSELHISNQNDPFFWENWVIVFYQDIIVAGIVRWSVVAVLGGLIVGILVSFMYLRFREYR